MKNIICLLETLAFVFGASFIVASDYEIVKTEREDGSAIEHSVAVSSRDIYYGDLLYFATLEKNVSTDELMVYRVPSSLEAASFCIDATLRYEGLAKEYCFEYAVYKPETLKQMFPYMEYQEFKRADRYRDRKRSVRNHATTKLLPGQERVFLLAVLELPTLDEWNEPFWRRVRCDVELNGIATISIEFRYLRFIAENLPLYREETVTTEIVIKKRPQKEMNLLDAWYDELITSVAAVKAINENWSSIYLPQLYNDVLSINGFEKKKDCKYGLDSISIKYLLEDFNDDVSRYPFYSKYGAYSGLMRPGSRKPPITSFPSSDADWETLDNSFVKSPLWNEIHFLRMIDKLFSDIDSEELEELIQSFYSWFDELPLLERYAIARRLYGSFHMSSTSFNLYPYEKDDIIKLRILTDQDDMFETTTVIASPLLGKSAE